MTSTANSVLNGLINHWPFNNCLNDQIDGANLYYSKSFFTEDMTKKRFSALSLNNDFYRVPPGVYFNGGDFTVVAWVRVKTRINLQILIDFGNGESNVTNNDNIVCVLSDTGTGKPSFYVYNGYVGRSVVSSEILEIGKWTQVAYVLERSNGYIYINDMRTASNGNFKAPNNVTRYWNNVGKSSWIEDPNTNADIDDLRIYSRALSPEEIRIMSIA
jgi:hypothetical protein